MLDQIIKDKKENLDLIKKTKSLDFLEKKVKNFVYLTLKKFPKKCC